jgi:outer membrane protein TolC
MILFADLDLFAQTINLEQARELALVNSRSLAKYNLSIRSSILEERNHLYSMLPSLSAEYSASMNCLDRDLNFVNPIDTLNAGAIFSITQTIFQGGKSFIQKAINAIATESVRNEALAEYFNVLDTVDAAYYAVLEAKANLEAAENSLQTSILSLSIAEIRHAGGMINQGDYLRALADKEALENSRNQARRNLSLNVARLNALTSLSHTAELEEINFDTYENMIRHLAGISNEDVDTLYERFWGTLVQANPSLIRATLNNQRAEQNLSLARRDYSPTISATIFSNALNYTTENGFTNSTGGGISIRGSIPLDFWVLSNRIEKSKTARDSAMLEYFSTVTSLETELYNVLINTFAQAESVLSSRRTLEYTERHFDYVMERYQLSQASVSDLGEASSLLITSRNNLIKARYGFLQSLSKLRSLGTITDEKTLARLILGNEE